MKLQNYLYRSVITVLGAVFFSCSYAEPSSQDVSKSWEKATVYVPGRFFTTSVSGVELPKPSPVVLLMHGCSGTASVLDWANYFKDAGYVAIVPDSFARERPLSCDPATKWFGLFPGVRNFRMDELRYALEQLKVSPWTDQRNIFLMGHSEGGAIVSHAGITGFRGVIVSGWLCVTRNNPARDGIKVPNESDLLVLNHERDPWYPYASGRQCSEFFGDRKNAREVVLPGTNHNTFEYPAKEAVLEFLKRNVAQ